MPTENKDKHMSAEIVVAVSGGFDPVHVGHLELFEKAKALGDTLVVIVNSDEFLIRKKGYFMMPLDDRVEILHSLRMVDYVFSAVDTDDTVCESLRTVEPQIFANGGDRTVGNSKEEAVCREIGCKTVFGLGEKIRSSSSYGMVKPSYSQKG